MKYKAINKPELFGLMRTLKLTDLRITDIDPAATMLTNLRSLDVSSNSLRRVENLCDGLVSLAAYNNEISEFDIPLSPSLMQLGLGFNQIERVSAASCTNLNSLVSLDLSYNKVRRGCAPTSEREAEVVSMTPLGVASLLVSSPSSLPSLEDFRS